MLALLLVAFASPSGSIEPNRTVDSQPDTLKFDILVRQPEERCEPTHDDEIIVCAEKSDSERYRLRPIPNAERYEQDQIKAEFAIGENATAVAEAEQAELGAGAQSKRLMVRLKIGF